MLKGFLWRRGVNGCGVWGMKIPYHKRFESICALHDLAYDEGTTSADRFKADRRMLKGMLALSDHWRYRVVARVYYGAVRMFGWLFFNYKIL